MRATVTERLDRLSTPKPAHDRYRRHVEDVCRTGDPRRCNECRGLEADASAETWRATNSKTTQRG